MSAFQSLSPFVYSRSSHVVATLGFFLQDGSLRNIWKLSMKLRRSVIPRGTEKRSVRASQRDNQGQKKQKRHEFVRDVSRYSPSACVCVYTSSLRVSRPQPTRAQKHAGGV